MNKKSLIEYFKISRMTESASTEGELCSAVAKHPEGINENSTSEMLGVLKSSRNSFEEVFEKATGKSYNNYLKKLEKIKKKEAKIEYEKKIPQRKLNLKKSNIKVIHGIFPEKQNKRHMIIKCKPKKRIILLNIWIRETSDSEFIFRLPEHVIITKDLNENIYAYYSKEPPYDFEIEYFFLKEERRSIILKGEQSSMLKESEQHTLKLFEEVNLIAKNLTPKVLELTPELKRKLT